MIEIALIKFLLAFGGGSAPQVQPPPPPPANPPTFGDPSVSAAGQQTAANMAQSFAGATGQQMANQPVNSNKQSLIGS